jgi:hypothetical protein
MSYEERTVRRFAWADTRCADGTWHRWEWLLYRQRYRQERRHYVLDGTEGWGGRWDAARWGNS